jgi:ubiquinone/menaquinone biosynthesis C-methylase UbiE
MKKDFEGAVVVPLIGHGFAMVRQKNRAWEFPGGQCKKGEAALQTAKRELREETGLCGKAWKEIGTINQGKLAVFACQAFGDWHVKAKEISEARKFRVPPMSLSFSRKEAFELLENAGGREKGCVDYDQAAEYFDDVRGVNPESLKPWLRNLIRYGEIRRNSLVLDIGCGTGRYATELMKETNAKVIGLDPSAGMLGKACKKRAGCWLRADAQNLPLIDNRFDAAIIMLVLQHVDDEPLALAEAWRMLKPGGKLVVVTVSQARIKRHIMRHFPGLVEIDLHRFLPIPELKWHLKDVGFERVRTHFVNMSKNLQPVESIISNFRKRYISTLILVSPLDFETGLVKFERTLRRLYGSSVESGVELTFLEARKPG